MKTEEKFKGCLILLGVGCGFLILEIIVALFIAWIISMIFGIDYFICATICIVIVFVIGDMDFQGDAKCTQCKRKIKTSNPIKCELCGGPALVTDKERKKYEKQNQKQD